MLLHPVEGIMFGVIFVSEADLYEIIIVLETTCKAKDIMRDVSIPPAELELFNMTLEKLDHNVISEQLGFNFEIKLV